MNHSIILQGHFVTLRPLTVSDSAMTFVWRQSHRSKLLNRGADSIEQQAAWIAARPASEYNFIIELKDGRPVGMLSVSGIDSVNRRAEPGRFLIGDEVAVRGVPAAVEAMKLLYHFVFDQLRMLRIWGTVASDNHLMVKWQKYLGMKEEGRLRRHYYIDGRFQDAIVLGLLVEEYRQISLPRIDVLIAVARSQDVCDLEGKPNAG